VAHRAVIFAIAQLSCISMNAMHQLIQRNVCDLRYAYGKRFYVLRVTNSAVDSRVKDGKDGSGRSTREAGSYRQMANSVFHNDRHSFHGTNLFSHAGH